MKLHKHYENIGAQTVDCLLISFGLLTLGGIYLITDSNGLTLRTLVGGLALGLLVLIGKVLGMQASIGQP